VCDFLADADGVFIVEHEGSLIAFPDPQVIYPQGRMLSSTDHPHPHHQQGVYSLPAPDDVTQQGHGHGQLVTPSVDTRYQCDHHRIFDDDDDDDNDIEQYRANNSIVFDDGRVCLVKGLHFIEKTATGGHRTDQPFGRRRGGGDDQEASTAVAATAAPRPNDDDTDAALVERIARMLDELGIGRASVISSVLTMASMGFVFFIYASARRIRQPTAAAANPEARGSRVVPKLSGGNSKRARRKARKNSQGRNDDDDDGEENEEGDDTEKNESGGGGGDEESEGEESGRRSNEESDEGGNDDNATNKKRRKRGLSSTAAKSRSTPVIPSERLNPLGEDGVLRVGQLGTLPPRVRSCVCRVVCRVVRRLLTALRGGGGGGGGGQRSTCPRSWGTAAAARWSTRACCTGARWP
jgi:hypothetical protein